MYNVEITEEMIANLKGEWNMINEKYYKSEIGTSESLIGTVKTAELLKVLRILGISYKIKNSKLYLLGEIDI